MAYEFKMPAIGEGISEGKIIKWEVSIGDTVEEDATLVEIQNDKLIQEVPSPVKGTILKILVEAGSTVQVGDVLAEIDSPDDSDTSTPAKEKPVDEEIEVTNDSEIQTPTTETQKQTSKESSTQSVVAERVLAMPSVRQYARDKDVELTNVSGSGKHNHIIKEDIDAYIADPVKEKAIEAKEETKKSSLVKQTAKETYSIAETEHTTREKMSVTRRAISQAMVNSQAHATHVAIFDEVEVSRLMAHLKRFKVIAAEKDINLTYLAYMIKAVISVLHKFPILNASVDEANEEIVYKHYFNLGFAVDTKRGLYVPNIKDANRKGIFTIAKEIVELANKAHEGTLESIEMRDGSTTITSIGSIGGMWFTPIINFPEVAIFGMGRIEKKPVVLEDNTLGVGNVLHLSMSFDHRIIDGAVAQHAMNELKRLLADPELLLMEG